VGHVENKTARAGSDVILTCQVRKLGNYKVSSTHSFAYLSRVAPLQTRGRKKQRERERLVIFSSGEESPFKDPFSKIPLPPFSGKDL